MDLVVPLIVFAVTMAIGDVIRRLFLRALRSWNQRTQSRPGLILAEALRGPIWIWILILAAHLAIQSSDLPDTVTGNASTLFADLWVISLTLLGMRIARDLVRYYGGQIHGVLAVTTLTQNLAQIAVLILGIMVLLGPYIKRLAPVLTALGVGGLAVALALQDTLSNLFAGFYVAVAGQIRMGDYIKLNTGEEGYVFDIGWRSTTMRALANNLIIIPNAKLAQAIVTNYHLPEKRISGSVQVGVSYASDPERIEAVLLEIARQASHEVPGMLAEPAPSVALDPGFGESALGFTLGYQVAEFVDQYSVRHELRKRILRRFREEGIEMPFPTRTVKLEGSAAPQDRAG